jgi:hypothetical protein
MAIRRTKSLGTKLTEDEFAQCQARAGTHTLSEWVRATLLLSDRPPDPLVQALFAEVVALRTILVHLHFAVANGDPLTVDQMQTLIDGADHDRWQMAAERIAAAAAKGRA